MAFKGNLDNLSELIVNALPNLNQSRISSNAEIVEARLCFDDDEDKDIEYQISIKIKMKGDE